MYRRISLPLFFILLSLLLGGGCAHHMPLPYEDIRTVYTVQDEKISLAHRFTPHFITHHSSAPYNRIGRPAARFDRNGNEEIYVESEDPVIYYMVREFTGKRGRYTNLIYRVHFSGTPFSLIPFNLTAGKNVGIMVVVTLDRNQQPLLVTTVHTCGCYLAIVPTTVLPRDAYPEKWDHRPLKVYGEILPNILDFTPRSDPLSAGPALVVHIRPGVHRVMGLEAAPRSYFRKSSAYRLIPAPLEAMENLERLPLNGGSTSFYHDEGVLKGHVKGAVKGWETLLLSLFSLDLFVGTDKAYADSDRTGNPFYTSLKPWNRNTSDMWHFADFLHFWGWEL